MKSNEQLKPKFFNEEEQNSLFYHDNDLHFNSHSHVQLSHSFFDEEEPDYNQFIDEERDYNRYDTKLVTRYVYVLELKNGIIKLDISNCQSRESSG